MLKFCLFICTYISIYSFGQEKEVKIKDDGEFSYTILLDSIKYKGDYFGSYVKVKIDGEKYKLPYGKGKFKSEKLSYEGYWIEGVFSGEGYCIMDSFNYNGFYSNGQKNGFGIIEYKTKNRYSGEWKDDALNGKGVFTFANGDIYEGSFLNGKREGFGKLKFKGNIDSFQKPKLDSTIYVFEGEFKNNEINGKGKLVCSDGFIFNGNWLNFNFSGDGRLYFDNGNYWKGQIINNHPQGRGVLTYPSGDNYFGDLFDNSFNGKGIYTFKDGLSWDGDWKNGQANGKMVIKSSKNEVLTSGNYVNNEMNGQGYKIMINGEKWEGEWKNDVPTGKGLIYFPNSNFYSGEWTSLKKDNTTLYVMHGKGTMKYNNGDVYNGDWFESKRNGLGKLVLSNGQVLEGEFVNDLFVEVFNPSYVNIGSQTWTNTNLNLDHFENGDKIKQVNSYAELQSSINNSEPAYCYLDFNSKNESKYGKLYNIFALQDPRGLAPKGWRLPTVKDFKSLENQLGGGRIAFDKIKANDEKIYTLDMIKLNIRNLCRNIEKNESDNFEGLSYLIELEKGLFLENEVNSGNNLSGFNALAGSYYINNEEPELFFSGKKKYYKTYEGYNAVFLTSDNGRLSLFPLIKSDSKSKGGHIYDNNENYYFGSVRLLKN